MLSLSAPRNWVQRKDWKPAFFRRFPKLPCLSFMRVVEARTAPTLHPMESSTCQLRCRCVCTFNAQPRTMKVQTMTFLSHGERAFLRAVSKLAYCNPFLPEHTELE